MDRNERPRLTPRLQTVGGLTAPFARWAGSRQEALEKYGLAGQMGIGVLIGPVWSPCIGHTLGATTVLASQENNLGEAALVMFAFGLGIASILLVLALATRGFQARSRKHMLRVGGTGKYVLGGDASGECIDPHRVRSSDRGPARLHLA